ncbi:MAG: hypothetical protein ABI162_18450 [Luteolibacter sp.]
MLKYFNLNCPTGASQHSDSGSDPFDVADMNAVPGKKSPPAAGDEKPSLPKPPQEMLAKKRRKTERHMSGLEQLGLYFGVFLGVLFSSSVMLPKTGTWSWPFAMRDLGLASIIALIIIPTAYSKLKINASAPFIVRFGFFVQTGVFWHEVVRVIGKSFG